MEKNASMKAKILAINANHMREKMTKDIENTILNCLKKSFNFELNNQGKTYELTVPFLDCHNDLLQIYIEKDEKNYKVSDGAYIKFEIGDNKFTPPFIGTTRFQTNEEIYAIVDESKLSNAVIDLITLMIITTYKKAT